MCVPSCETYLLGLPRFSERGTAAMRPGLATIRTLLAAMGNPHDAFECVHVAGTNGKGTMASLLASIATASGRRTGLHTSPHLATLRERMRIDGAPAPETWLHRAVTHHRAVFDATKATYFEATTALSFLYFAECSVDVAVVEVGLGGRLDATNILTPRLSVITTIALEHTDILGDTLQDIAREKGGITKPGVPLITGVGQPEILAILEGMANVQDAPLYPTGVCIRTATTLQALTLSIETPVNRYPELTVPLAGVHQRTNVLLAVRAAEILFPDVCGNPAIVQEGLSAVRRHSGLRARLELVRTDPVVLLDVAHNPAALEAALAFAKTHGACLFVILSVMADKNVPAMTRMLAAARAHTFACSLDSPRALPADHLASILHAGGASVSGHGALQDAMACVASQAAADDVCLIAGSHYLAAQALQEDLAQNFFC